MKIAGAILFLFVATIVKAQDSATKTPEMGNIMRSNGRIFVVVAVMLVILGGLILYLVKIERRVNRIERG